MTYNDYVQIQDEINNSPLFQGDTLELNSARQLMELIDTLPTLKRVIIEENNND